MKIKVISIITILLIIIAVFFTILPHIHFEKDTPCEQITSKTEKKSDIFIIDVPKICQFPLLPTGCEATAAAMVLQYYGENITHTYFAENWLKKSEDFYTLEDTLYGPDPNKVFAGNPFSKNSFGCFSGAIIEAINTNSNTFFAEGLKEKTLSEICKKYIDKKIPIIIWATMGMKPSEEGKSWCLENRETFSWIAGEHCLVLVGYDINFYYFNDPQSGSIAAYEKGVCEKRFKELNTQAIFIQKK